MTDKKKSILKEVIGYIIIAVLFWFLFSFVLMITYVDGNSMNDTYQDGDTLLCFRTSSLEKNDVVVLTTDDGVTLIKRVIATGGDTLDIDFESGEVTLCGNVLDEPYIKEPTYVDEGGHQYPVTVPEGCYFVMGDNRNHSEDSRSERVGFVTKEQVKGKVILEVPFF